MGIPERPVGHLSRWAYALLPIIVLAVVGIFAAAGGFRPPESIEPPAPSPGPLPVARGPRSILLRTPHCSGNTSFEISVAFSPDGGTVAVGRTESYRNEAGDYLSSASVVSLCRAGDGEEYRRIEGPIDETCSVAFSPDGKTLAVGYVRNVKLFDPETGRERSVLEPKWGGYSMDLEFSPDGTRLASAGHGEVHIWDVASGKEAATLEPDGGAIHGVSFSPDGTKIASAGYGPMVCRSSGGFFILDVGCGPDGGRVYLWDATTGKESAQYRHSGCAYSVVFSPEGRSLASGGPAGVKVRDMSSGQVERLMDNGLCAYSLAYSPDGRHLAVGMGGSSPFGSFSGEVWLWDVESRRVRSILKDKMGPVRSLAFSLDGRTLVTGSPDAIRLWDVEPEAVDPVDEGTVPEASS
jgi:WD40 repeat protein